MILVVWNLMSVNEDILEKATKSGRWKPNMQNSLYNKWVRYPQVINQVNPKPMRENFSEKLIGWKYNTLCIQKIPNKRMWQEKV